MRNWILRLLGVNPRQRYEDRADCAQDIINQITRDWLAQGNVERRRLVEDDPAMQSGYSVTDAMLTARERREGKGCRPVQSSV